MVPYDRSTMTYWSQMGGFALKGPLLGNEFSRGFSTLTTWGTWKKIHPNTVVLNRPVGSTKDYLKDPYASYANSDRILYNSCFDQLQIELPYRMKPSKEITVVVITKDGNAHLFPKSEIQTIQNVEDLYEQHFVLIWVTNKQYSIAFNRVINGTIFSFYNIGLSTNNGVADLPLFRDQISGSIWNSTGYCISGSLRGLKLEKLVLFNSYWYAAISIFPKSQIWQNSAIFQYLPTSCPIPSSESKCSVPCSSIISAGPSIDAIKSIDSPVFITAEQFENIPRIPVSTVSGYIVVSSLLTLFAIFLQFYCIYLSKKAKDFQINENVKKYAKTSNINLKEDDEEEVPLPPESVSYETPSPQKKSKGRKKKYQNKTFNGQISDTISNKIKFANSAYPIPRLEMQPWKPSNDNLVQIQRNKSDSHLNEIKSNIEDPETNQKTIPTQNIQKKRFSSIIDSIDLENSFDSKSQDYLVTLSSLNSTDDDELPTHISKAALERIKSNVKELK